MTSAKEIEKRFEFGKIDARGNGRKANAVAVDLCLTLRGGEPTSTYNAQTREYVPAGKTTPEYYEISLCGWVWNERRTDCIMGGQCLDHLRATSERLRDDSLFKELFGLWQRWHLNGLHAGTPEQEAAIKEWEAAGNRYDYTKACEMLKARGLYEVPFTGLTVGRRYNGELYKYGHGWVVEELPADVVARVAELIGEEAPTR